MGGSPDGLPACSKNKRPSPSVIPLIMLADQVFLFSGHDYITFVDILFGLVSL